MNVPSAATSASPGRLSGEHAKSLLVLLLCLAWLLPGLVGHDPWKPEEANTFGRVYHVLQTGDWVVPALGGEPSVEGPPLYHVVAAFFARLFSSLLPLHDGARLASGLFTGLAVLLSALTAREFFGAGRGRVAALLLVGSVGLLVRGHEMLVDTALLAGFVLALYGLAVAPRRGAWGGVLLGTGVGVAFLSKGLLAPLEILAIALLLPLHPRWRSRGYALALGVALLAALPWLAVWPWALYQRAPRLLAEWWRHDLGRYLDLAALWHGTEEHGYFPKLLSWFAWPAWPIALWTLWSGGRKGVKEPGVHFALTVVLVLLAVLLAVADASDLNALPLLPALAILAAPGVDSLRRGAYAALDWFGVMTFGLFSGFLWLGWIAMLTGWPAKLAERAHVLQPAYQASFEGIPFAVALTYTLTWLLLLSRLGRARRRAVINWAAGIALMWGLLTTLWLPWIDTGKTYRNMIADMKRALPARYDCMASRALGEPQRAMLQYYAGIVTYRDETRPRRCELLLVQGGAGKPPHPGAHWQKLWEGARPGDNSERFWLYRRAP
jgi:4-amino-4-deoxy-L-arabinose transferase-like glycosyltransferase